jgi:hypothetical protein
MEAVILIELLTISSRVMHYNALKNMEGRHVVMHLIHEQRSEVQRQIVEYQRRV